ncbi:MAG: alpha/beta family hydrolase [Terrimicrobiaceae bacterium]
MAPGAGAPSSHPWMRHWAESLGTIGIVRAFDYPYMIEGRKRPDSLPKLIASHRAALRQARQAHSGQIVLIGKSMGSRIGCHVATEEKVSAVVCLGYPLCGGGDRTKLRDKVLLQLATPILFVQGTRDPLCPLDLLQQVRDKLSARNELYVVEGGNHSLIVTKRDLRDKGQTQEDVDGRILAKISRFVVDNA